MAQSDLTDIAQQTPFDISENFSFLKMQILLSAFMAIALINSGFTHPLSLNSSIDPQSLYYHSFPLQIISVSTFTANLLIVFLGIKRLKGDPVVLKRRLISIVLGSLVLLPIAEILVATLGAGFENSDKMGVPLAVNNFGPIGSYLAYVSHLEISRSSFDRRKAVFLLVLITTASIGLTILR
jgi:hypothetical protein